MSNEKFFRILFNDDEWTCYGNFFVTQAVPVNTLEFAKGVPYQKSQSKSNGEWYHQKTEFYCVNPLFPNSTRSDANVSSCRNFVFEFDSFYDSEKQPSTEKAYKYQRTLLKYAMEKHLFPLSAAVYSGSKSIHALVCLEESVERNKYKEIWWRLAKKITTIAQELNDLEEGNPLRIPLFKKISKNLEYSKTVIADRACQNPSRLTRFPGVVRDEVRIINGRECKLAQQIVFLNKRIPNTVLEEYLNTCPENKKREPKEVFKIIPSNNYLSDQYDRIDFLASCSKQLMRKIQYFEYNSSESGMHPIIFEFYCRLKTEFPSMTINYARALCEDLIYPYLRAVGYDERKIYNNDLESAFLKVGGSDEDTDTGASSC